MRLADLLMPCERAEEVKPDKSYRLLGVRLEGNGAFHRETKMGSQTSAKRLNRVRTGDIIYSRLFAWRGAFGIITPELDSAFVSDEFPTFRCDERRLLSAFLLRWLSLPSTIAKVEEDCTGSTPLTRNRFKEQFFLSLEIPLPSLDEQKRIVERLDSINSRVEKVATLRTEADTLSDRVPTLMAHRRDMSAEQKVAEGWRHLTLADCMEEKRDLVRVDVLQEYRNVGMYSFARGLFHKPPIIGSQTTAPTLTRIHAGQFIYSRLFAFEGAYGWVTPDHDGAFVSNEYPTFDCKPTVARAEFLAAYFRLPEVWRTVAHGSKGLGDRRQRVQPAKILEHALWVPPIKLQDRLAAIEGQNASRRGSAVQVLKKLDALVGTVLSREMAAT